jgi:hypothetical protein
MRIRRRALTSALAAVAVVAAGLVAAAPAHAVDGLTYFQMRGDAGDYIAGPTTYSYTAPTADINATLTGGTAYVSVAEGSHWWFIDLRAPQGEEFVAGTTYTDAQRASFAVAPHPGIDIYGDGRGCNTVSGSFSVLEFEKDAGTGDVTRFAATFEQHCEGGTAAARGTIAWNAAKSPVTIASTTPTTAILNGPVTVSGKLTDLVGPVSGAAVTVTRPAAGGGTVTLNATTGADGSFSVQDTIGTTAQTYTVTYSGDASHYEKSRTITVTPVKVPTAFALTAPTTTLKRGTTYSLAGSLKGAGVGIAGATVTLVRTDLRGSKTIYVKTSSSGKFVVKDTPTIGGAVTWRATWPGTARYATPKPGTRTINVARTSTSLSITTNATSYAYGATARITVHLGTTYNNRTVSVFARKTITGKTTLIKTATVGSTGNLVLSVPVTSKTLYSVKFAGDYRYLPAADSRTVNVRSKVVVTLSGAYGRSGSTYLYRVGENVPVTVTVWPKREGPCVSLVAQRQSGSSWVTTATLSCAPLSAISTTYATLYTNGASGNGRIMASIGSDAYASAGSSPWVYFRTG